MSCPKHDGIPIEEISDCEACLRLAGLWSYTDLDQHDEQHDLGVCGKPDPE